jgi:hypothetical protein
MTVVGPGANYANNEDFTLTLCPDDGPGSDCATVVHFTSFDAGHNDELVILDGTSIGGAIWP